MLWMHERDGFLHPIDPDWVFEFTFQDWGVLCTKRKSSRIEDREEPGTRQHFPLAQGTASQASLFAGEVDNVFFMLRTYSPEQSGFALCTLLLSKTKTNKA